MILALLITICTNIGQNGWDQLSKVSFSLSSDEVLAPSLGTISFSESVLQLDGTTITLVGYVIPLELTKESKYFVVSRFPFQSCFFCGGAGPETVAEVYAENLVSQTDRRISVTGTLYVNEDDPLHLPYLIKEAKVSFLD